MRKILNMIDSEYQVLVFASVGLGCIFFPSQIRYVLPYLLGGFLITIGAARLIYRFRARIDDISICWAVINIILGILIIVHRHDSIGIIGSIWAMLTLSESAAEIDYMVKVQIIEPFHLILAIASAGFAFILLFDPAGAFEHHIRILGIEMILQALSEQSSKEEDFL